MTDRLDEWTEADPYGGGSAGPHVIEGEVWHRETHPLPAQHPVPPGVPQYGVVVPTTPLGGIPHQRGHSPGQPGQGGHSPGQPGQGGRTAQDGRPGPRTRRPRRRLLRRLVLLLFCLLLVVPPATYLWAELSLDRAVDLGKNTDRAPLGRGTNYLVVGSDSRQGMSEEERRYLHTGGSADEGARTDSIMVLHTGANGTTMLSLPRDSWVTIPPYVDPETGVHHPAAKNKLNASFSLGGPNLLVRTIESNTGLRVDHYAEIGFGGFVGVVDAVGGVTMCLDKAVKDPKSGVNLTKGCHNLDGRRSLAFVRQRHQEANGDLGRSQNQQKFLAALAHKAATPQVMFNPFKIYPVANAGLSTLTVDNGMALPDLASLFQSLRGVSTGNGKRLNVPVSNMGYRTPKGSAVLWNVPQAKKLFAELRSDRPVTLQQKN